MNVLRDTHSALVPGGLLLDFHPTHPPWARLTADGEELGEVEEPDFPEQVRAAEASVQEVVRRGLFAPVASRVRDISEHYDDADEVIETWGECIPADVQPRVRGTTGPLALVYKVVFDLYRALDAGSTASPTRTRPGTTTSP